MADETQNKIAAIENLDLKPTDVASAASALDGLFIETAKAAGATEADLAALKVARPEDAPPPNIHETTDLDDAVTKARERTEKIAADKAAKEKAEADAKAAAEAAAADPAKVEADRIAKEAADKAAADAAAAAPKNDELDKIELPPHSSAKAGENFALLKKVAREQVTAVETKLADLNTKHLEATKELEELRTKVAELPPDVKAELEDLRKFKISQDITADPTFRKFDGEITANHEAIYKKLMQSGYTQENIDHIKSLGGPDNVDWKPLFEKLPAQTQLYLQGKLVANIELADKRDAALEAAKADGPKFLQERAQKDSTALLTTANGHLKALAWTGRKQLPATATPAQKAEIEAWNKEADEAVTTVKSYLSDRSPERHAELAIGTLIAHRLGRQLDVATAKITAIEAAHKLALDAVTKERDALKTDLEKIKLAAIPRTNTTTGTIKPAPKTGLLDNRDRESILDAHMAELLAGKI